MIYQIKDQQREIDGPRTHKKNNFKVTKFLAPIKYFHISKFQISRTNTSNKKFNFFYLMQWKKTIITKFFILHTSWTNVNTFNNKF